MTTCLVFITNAWLGAVIEYEFFSPMLVGHPSFRQQKPLRRLEMLLPGGKGLVERIDGDYANKGGLTGLPAGEAASAFPEVAFAGPNSPGSWRGTDSRDAPAGRTVARLSRPA